MSDLKEQIDNILFSTVESIGVRDDGKVIDLDTLILDRQKAIDRLATLLAQKQIEALEDIDNQKIVIGTAMYVERGEILDRIAELKSLKGEE